MKAIVLRDLINQTVAVFVRNEVTEDDEKKIRLTCKESGFLVVIKEVTAVTGNEELCEEIRALGDDK